MYLPSGKLAAWKSCSNLSKVSELSGSIEEGPLGLSSSGHFSSSRPMTEVEDLGMDSLGSGRERMRLKVSTSSAYWEGTSDRATSLDSVEVDLDQREPQRALKTCVWLQRTDRPLKRMTRIWTSPYVYSCQHVFWIQTMKSEVHRIHHSIDLRRTSVQYHAFCESESVFRSI